MELTKQIEELQIVRAADDDEKTKHKEPWLNYLETKDLDIRWKQLINPPQLNRTENVAWSRALLQCFRGFKEQGRASEV